MLYTTSNIQTSLTTALATLLRANGYDVYWHASGVTETQTAGLGTAKAVVTLVPEFPANPTSIVRLNDANVGEETVVVPALTLHVLGSPRRIRLRGLGHSDYEWARTVRIDGLAADEFQQRELQDLLYSWLHDTEWKEIPVFDYEADASSPPQLDPVYVQNAVVDRQELYLEVEAARYYLRALINLYYIE